MNLKTLCILDDFGFVFIYVTLIFVSQLIFSSQKDRTIKSCLCRTAIQLWRKKHKQWFIDLALKAIESHTGTSILGCNVQCHTSTLYRAFIYLW